MDISKKLLNWYLKNKRDLPWRETKNPYNIWLSEVILQQTRVGQGMAYYQKFISNYPTIFDLANATENNVLNLWQGLGYYSRARNLHHASREIVKKYNGNFPNTYKEIIQLKGVGEYTAAAIASIAFNLPFATVDGNVFRVLSRLYGIELPINELSGIKAIKKIANTLLDKENPGTHNQALMEFGALQCVPQSPNCQNCLFNYQCAAYLHNKVQILPVKVKKLIKRTRHFYYFEVRYKHCIILRQRSTNDIWKQLFELPLLETEKPIDYDKAINWFVEKNGSGFNIEKFSLPKKVYKHMLTHQTIMAHFFVVHLKNQNHLKKYGNMISINDISNYAIPRLIQKYFQERDLIE